MYLCGLSGSVSELLCVAVVCMSMYDESYNYIYVSLCVCVFVPTTVHESLVMYVYVYNPLSVFLFFYVSTSLL